MTRMAVKVVDKYKLYAEILDLFKDKDSVVSKYYCLRREAQNSSWISC
jgi:hypothetical protein